MATADIADLKSYIAGLELAEPSAAVAALAPAAPMVEDETKAGYVDDGSLVSFVAGVSQQHKHDILNSTLLAQLAANKQYDREKETVEWYKFYREVLENVGWVIQAFDFTEFKAGGAQFSVDEVVLKILAAIATQNDIAIVAETIEALKGLSDDDGRVVLFNSDTHELNKGNFQIGVASESDGVAVMKLGTFYFSTSETVTRVLWFRFKSADTSFYKGAQTVNLNEDVYGQVCQAVIDKLGDKAQTFVRDLPI